MAELNEKISDEPIVPLFDAAGVNTDNEHNPLIPPSIILPTATEVPPSVSLAGLQKQYHSNRSAYAYGTGGQNLLQQMDNDTYFAARRDSGNFHYPFASQDEWGLAHWLTSSSLPQSEVDAFLRLNWVSLFYQNYVRTL